MKIFAELYRAEKRVFSGRRDCSQLHLSDRCMCSTWQSDRWVYCREGRSELLLLCFGELKAYGSLGVAEESLTGLLRSVI